MAFYPPQAKPPPSDIRGGSEGTYPVLRATPCVGFALPAWQGGVNPFSDIVDMVSMGGL
jgi:hypothetical protein